jgi:hypothetical protein
MRRVLGYIGEGWIVFVALWMCGAALFLLSFLNLRSLGQQGFIPVRLFAERLADYSADEGRSEFLPVKMDLIRVAIEDQAGGTQAADQRLDQLLTQWQTPIPSVAPLAMLPSQSYSKFAKATPTETDIPEKTKKPSKTPRPTSTPRPGHTPRNAPSPTSTPGPLFGASSTPTATGASFATATPTPRPSSTPGPAVTKKPSKTPKPTKTPRH